MQCLLQLDKQGGQNGAGLLSSALRRGRLGRICCNGAGLYADRFERQ